MINNTRFLEAARKEMARRNLSQVRLALDLHENPVAVAQMFSGFRPHKRLREKIARYFNIPLGGK